MAYAKKYQNSLVPLLLVASIGSSSDYNSTIQHLIDRADSKKFTANPFIEGQIKREIPNLYSKYLDAKKKADKYTQQKLKILILISNSMSRNEIYDFVVSAGIIRYYFGITTDFAVAGFFDQGLIDKFKSISDELDHYDYGALYKKNLKLKMNPKAFLDLKVEDVPAIILEEKENNAFAYKYIAAGGTMTKFFEKISKKDAEYEKIYNKLYNTLY